MDEPTTVASRLEQIEQLIAGLKEDLAAPPPDPGTPVVQSGYLQVVEMDEEKEAGFFARLKTALMGGEKDSVDRSTTWNAIRQTTTTVIEDNSVHEYEYRFADQNGAFKSFKDAAGARRWVAVYSNTFKDSDGEAFSYEAHKDFVDRIDAGTVPMPEVWLWHTPGTKVGQADIIDLSTEGFMVASGTFDAAKEHIADKLAEMGPLGVSHGFHYPVAGGLKNGIYQPGYDTFEISPLPAERAANKIGTGFMPVTEEVMLTKKSWLDKLGAQETENLEKGVAAAFANAKAENREPVFKDVKDAIEAIEAEPVVETKADATPDAVAAEVTKQMSPVLAALASLKESLDEMKGEAAASKEKQPLNFTPRAQPFVASESKETEVDGEEMKKELGAFSQSGEVPAHLRNYMKDLVGATEVKPDALTAAAQAAGA